jgi:hypothetical protein
MRLLNTHTIKLKEFLGKPPPYAILSHTWGEEEVLFHDIQNDTAETKKGFAKIKALCEKAKEHQYDWVWIDTCAIDKTSSAELSEAINSMYQWYQQAIICYAYLDDFTEAPLPHNIDSLMKQSRWFTRGWTLQELLVPRTILFYSQNWKKIGTKIDLAKTISDITRIPEIVLTTGDMSSIDIGQKFSWASDRVTTRKEDIAYCLMGLFDVNMPLLYGEGDKAFMRLQEQILSKSDDHSIFVWHIPVDKELDTMSFGGILASSPKAFTNYRPLIPLQNWNRSSPFSLTNQGWRIEFPIYSSAGMYSSRGIYYALLNCRFLTGENPVAIQLCPVTAHGDQFTRVVHSEPVDLPLWKSAQAEVRTIFIKPAFSFPRSYEVQRSRLVVICSFPSRKLFRVDELWPMSTWNADDQAFLLTESDERVGIRFTSNDSNNLTFVTIIGFEQKHSWVNFTNVTPGADLSSVVKDHTNSRIEQAQMHWEMHGDVLIVSATVTKKDLGPKEILSINIQAYPHTGSLKKNHTSRAIYLNSKPPVTSGLIGLFTHVRP